MPNFPLWEKSRILKVILELTVDCNNYSHNQRSPYSEYGSYTQSHIGTRS